MSEARWWARVGGWLGVAWPPLFMAVMVVNIGPETHSVSEELSVLGQTHFGHVNMYLHTLAALAGLFGIGWVVALSYMLQSEKPNPLAKLAATFGVAGFAMVMAMLIVQGSVQSGIAEQFTKLTSDSDRAATIAAFRAVRWVDLGLDFTWDIFIAWAMILFGAAMFSTRIFGKLWGGIGITMACLLFVLDVRSAPHPAEPEISPISFVWFIGVSVKMLLFARQEKHSKPVEVH